MTGRAQHQHSGEALVSSLATVFVIVYLQEAAWIFAPLIISANILLHFFLKPLEEDRLPYLAAFLFFLITGISTVIGLWCIHHRALAKLKQRYLLPYFVTKLLRICVLMAVAIYIVIDDMRRKSYFYVSCYGVFECLAGIVSLEIVYRSWKYLRKAKRQKVQENEVLWRQPPNCKKTKSSSLRSCQSIP